MFFFLLTYRLGESQLAKIASPFLLDGAEQGGLGLFNLHPSESFMAPSA